MKRLLILLLAFTLTLSGCSAAKPAVQSNSNASNKIKTDAPIKEESILMTDETAMEETVSPEDCPQTEGCPQTETAPATEEIPVQTPAASTTTQKKPTQLVNTTPTKQETATNSQTTKPSTPASGNPTAATYPAATDNTVLMFARNAKTIFVGEQDTLDIFYFGNKKLSWYSSHPIGLTVDQSGVITPLCEGNYKVYVTDGEYTAMAMIFAPVGWGMSSGLFFDHLQTELTVGKSTLLNLNGVAPGYSISYSSSNASVVRVSGSYITAVSPGIAIVTAKEPYGQMAKMLVTVVPASETVSLDIRQDSIDLYRLEELSLGYHYSGTATLEWNSSNVNVARVDENGRVCAYGEGSCYIYLSDGTYADQCKVTVTVDPTVTVTKLDFNNINAPIYDGITKYKGDYMEFQVSIFPQNGDEDTYITVSNSQIIKATRTYSMGDYIFRLDFKKAGTCTVNIHSGDHAVTNSYTFHVKEDYDCNPGKNLLTPEDFVNCNNQVLQANGMSLDYKPTGYLVLTLSPEELTWAQARKSAEGLGHHWWSIGYRHMLITYEGQDQNGNYIFYERGC